MEKSSAPFLLEGEPIWNDVSIRGNVVLKYEPIT